MKYMERKIEEYNQDHGHSRSEEITDIIERMPTGWTRTLSFIITIIIAVILFLGLVIKYPDTISGKITVTYEFAPVRIMSQSNGRLHLLAQNSRYVPKGACVGFIDNGAVFWDIVKLDSICAVKITHRSMVPCYDSLCVGSLSAVYNEFALSYQRYDRLRQGKMYDNMRRALLNQRKTAQEAELGIQAEINVHEQSASYVQRQYEGDSMLHAQGAISRESLNQQHSSFLSTRQKSIELRLAKQAKHMEINNIDIALAKIDLEEEEELMAAYTTLLTKHNMLVNEVRIWKERFLCTSPIDGFLEYLGFWRENEYVQSNTELFSISPTDNHLVGELCISPMGAGRVEVGMDVNVKLASFPYHEYGYVKGKVQSISNLTREINTPEGSVPTYLVRVAFPNGLVSNYGQQLSVNSEAIGTGEIITRKRRLVHRLFDNIKTQTEK